MVRQWFHYLIPLYPVKMSFRNEGGMNTFLDAGK